MNPTNDPTPRTISSHVARIDARIDVTVETIQGEDNSNACSDVAREEAADLFFKRTGYICNKAETSVSSCTTNNTPFDGVPYIQHSFVVLVQIYR